jgi:hypothetical protein
MSRSPAVISVPLVDVLVALPFCLAIACASNALRAVGLTGGESLETNTL